MPARMILGRGPSVLTIAADTTDYDVRAAVVAAGGDPATRLDVVVTIAAGVVVYQTSANGALHLSASVWTAGTTLKINNNGTICGKGGAGGNGGHRISDAGKTNGTTGFAAIYFNNANVAVTIDNTTGYIFGGGGGGGGASGGLATDGTGGGGGRGRLGGAAGVNDGAGSVPTAGTFAAAGVGGLNAVRVGGDGGDWGQAGIDGSAGVDAGGIGGTAGPAINKGATALAWTGGINAAQVKGAIT